MAICIPRTLIEKVVKKQEHTDEVSIKQSLKNDSEKVIKNKN